jgi:REP element-mobilizing transposase RayT
MSRFRKNAPATKEFFNGNHRFEHWYRDNSVYFITARCKDRYPSFESEQAKAIFKDRFNYYANHHGFVPFVITLLDNHYHVLGYLRDGNNLGPMMQKIHGSVAKVTNDLLPERIRPFWRDSTHHDYFDGCIRDVLQCRRAYRYTLFQSVRHSICSDYRDYSHTHVEVELEAAIRRSVELKAFMEGVPYARYERHRARTGRPA